MRTPEEKYSDEMSILKCKCSLAIALNGDGCRYCQPQEYIDRLALDNEVLHKHHEAMIRRAKRTLAIMNEGFER